VCVCVCVYVCTLNKVSFIFPPDTLFCLVKKKVPIQVNKCIVGTLFSVLPVFFFFLSQISLVPETLHWLVILKTPSNYLTHNRHVSKLKITTLSIKSLQIPH